MTDEGKIRTVWQFTLALAAVAFCMAGHATTAFAAEAPVSCQRTAISRSDFFKPVHHPAYPFGPFRAFVEAQAPPQGRSGSITPDFVSSHGQ